MRGEVKQVPSKGQSLLSDGQSPLAASTTRWLDVFTESGVERNDLKTGTEQK